MRQQGRITTWKDDQGYGFITQNGGGEPVFLHIKAFNRGQARPAGDEIVTYELAQDNRGRLRAEAVALVGRSGLRAATRANGRGRWPLILCGLYFAFLLLSTLTGKLPLALPGFYAIVSLITFAAYAIDKSAAQDGRWRTPENTLHLLALCGGWPGALLAQWQLRHKSAKTAFQIIFWATVLANCGVLGFFLTQPGSRALRTLLGT